MLKDVAGLVAADPAVDLAPIPDFPTQELPHWYTERLPLDVPTIEHSISIQRVSVRGERGDEPKCDVQTRDCAHEDFTTTVEPLAVSELVDILDVGRVPAYETFLEVFEGAFDGFRVTCVRFNISSLFSRKKKEIGTYLRE